jgi:sugar/nucleoside kinase (ribokinase family)
MSHDLVVMGDLVTDLVLSVKRLPLVADRHNWASGLSPELGGSCNSIVAARRLGLHTAALGAVGDDAYGRDLIDMLLAEGVDVAGVVTSPDRRIVLCVVIVDELGKYVYLGVKDEGGAFPSSTGWRNVIQASRSLLTFGYSLHELLAPSDILKLMRAAQEAAVPVYFDPGPSARYLAPETLRSAIAATDVLLLTAEEAHETVGIGERSEAARALSALGPSSIVIKTGAEGCFLWTADEEIRHPGFAIELVDAVGAGDAFAAALIAGRLRGGGWADCLALANAMGAVTAATRGAGRRIPPVERVLELLGDDPAARLARSEARHPGWSGR